MSNFFFPCFVNGRANSKTSFFPLSYLFGGKKEYKKKLFPKT